MQNEQSTSTLAAMLHRELRRRRFDAIAAKYLSVGLSFLGVCCSAFAGIKLGYTSSAPPFWLSIVATMPALTTALQERLRLNDRDNWHTCFADECASLLQRLEIEHEDENSVSRSLRETRELMRLRWERGTQSSRREAA